MTSYGDITGTSVTYRGPLPVPTHVAREWFRAGVDTAIVTYPVSLDFLVAAHGVEEINELADDEIGLEVSLMGMVFTIDPDATHDYWSHPDADRDTTFIMAVTGELNWDPFEEVQATDDDLAARDRAINSRN